MPVLRSLVLPLLLVPLLGSLVACGADGGAESGAPDASIETSESSTTSVRSESSSTVSSSAGSSSTAAPPTSGSSDSGSGDCQLVADLEDADELARWQIVNDGVMGGRSSAEATVVDSVLILVGEIVTEGGGFSSVRLALDEPLGDVTSLVFRLRTDGRAYDVTVADAAPGRDRRVSHQGPIPAVGDGEWEEIAVDLADLDASIFGQPVDVDPFDPGTSVEVGIILSDGSDGPFRLELDWIRACP